MVEPVAPAPEPTPTEPLAPVVTPSVPLVDNAAAQADAEELKKQLQKMEMERNLLRKQKDERDRLDADRERKELEEKEDYRSLAERAIAEAEALRKEKSDAESAQAVKVATETIYSGFDSKVVEIAKTAGVVAADDSPEAQTALKTKLEAIQAQVGTKPINATPNNPAPRVVTPATETKFLNPADYKDSAERRGAAIWKNNRTATERLKNSSAIAAMKQISGMEPQEI